MLAIDRCGVTHLENARDKKPLDRIRSDRVATGSWAKPKA